MLWMFYHVGSSLLREFWVVNVADISCVFDSLRRGATRATAEFSVRRVNGARPLIMDRSTTRRIAPTRSLIFPVIHNARDSGVTAGKGKHLCAPLAIVLRVVVDE